MSRDSSTDSQCASGIFDMTSGCGRRKFDLYFSSGCGGQKYSAEGKSQSEGTFIILILKGRENLCHMSPYDAIHPERVVSSYRVF